MLCSAPTLRQDQAGQCVPGANEPEHQHRRWDSPDPFTGATPSSLLLLFPPPPPSPSPPHPCNPEAINHAAEAWGILCMRYEIRDIQLPTKVKEAMQMQVR